jgi:hypothetical protein
LGELFSRPSQQEVETTRSLLDTLLTEARLYRTTADYKALLDFVVRLRNFAPYNAMLLQVQKPGLTYAASAVRPLSALVRATVAPLPRIGRQGFVFTTGGDRPLGGFGHDCAATGAAANSGVNNAASINVQVRRRAPTIGPPIGYCEETSPQGAAKEMRQKLAPARQEGNTHGQFGACLNMTRRRFR